MTRSLFRPAVIAALVTIAGAAGFLVARAQTAPAPPKTVVFDGPANSPISSWVAIPAGRATLFTSGTVPPVADSNAPAGSAARYGDTKTQAIGILNALQVQLGKQGLSLKDVVYLRVYVTPDPAKENKPDFAGWFAAYGQFFGTKDNPTKPARSTISVPTLVSPDWRIEIEAVAVYPAP